jgi:hypothetical protein
MRADNSLAEPNFMPEGQHLRLVAVQDDVDERPFEAPYVYFPVEWDFTGEGHQPNDGLSGKPVEDVTTLYVCAPTDDATQQKVWACSIEGALNVLIDDSVDGSGKFSPEFSGKMTKLRDALMRIVARLDGGIVTGDLANGRPTTAGAR